MATILAKRTIGRILFLNVDADPSLGSGISAPLGSIATINDGTGFFYKVGFGNTQWNNMLVINYDADALLYFAQLTGTIPISFKLAINSLIIKLKYDNNWDKLKRFWIHGTPFQQNATISLVNPASTPITEFNAPSWTTKEGYTGNGINAYLDTNFNIFTQGAPEVTLNDASYGVWSRTNTTGDKVSMGASNGVDGFIQMYPMFVTNAMNAFWADGANGGNFAVSDSLGLFSMSRTSNVQTTLYKNGVSLGNVASPTIAAALPNFNLFVLANNGAGGPNHVDDRQISASFVGKGSLNHATFYEALNEFFFNYMDAGYTFNTLNL